MSKFNPHRWVEPEAEVLVAEPTISLRDYFAGQASEEDIQDMLSILICNGMPANRFTARWAFADAMLEARGEVQP